MVDRDPIRGELWHTERICENGHIEIIDQWLRKDQIAVADH